MKTSRAVSTGSPSAPPTYTSTTTRHTKHAIGVSATKCSLWRSITQWASQPGRWSWRSSREQWRGDTWQMLMVLSHQVAYQAPAAPCPPPSSAGRYAPPCRISTSTSLGQDGRCRGTEHQQHMCGDHHDHGCAYSEACSRFAVWTSSHASHVPSRGEPPPPTPTPTCAAPSSAGCRARSRTSAPTAPAP